MKKIALLGTVVLACAFVSVDPIANVKLVENPEKNFVVIMKDGKIYKNALK